MEVQDMEPFYRDGLKFECHGCGHCCTGQPGYVFASEEEILALARLLKIGAPEFYQRYVRRVPGGYSLLERADGTCIFYDDGCTVYLSRPRQCRTYPFWPAVLATPESWLEESKSCPGIGQGRLYDFVTIEGLLRGGGETSAGT